MPVLLATSFAFANCSLGAHDLAIEMLLIVKKSTREINGQWNPWQLSATKKNKVKANLCNISYAKITEARKIIHNHC